MRDRCRQGTAVERGRQRAKYERRKARKLAERMIAAAGAFRMTDVSSRLLLERAPNRCVDCSSEIAPGSMRCEGCRPHHLRAYGRDWNRRNRPGSPRRFVAGSCGECGANFVADSFGAAEPPRYCSTECSRKRQRRAAKQARSTRIRHSGHRDSISLRVLACRDRWRCHICGRSVSAEDWSVDHLVPLVRGGPHRWENVALAHHLCNSLRGAAS